jgi:putative AlgH/UPF0301 family transcriptional regulator
MASTAAAREILVKQTLVAICAELADSQFKRTVVFGIKLRGIFLIFLPI